MTIRIKLTLLFAGLFAALLLIFCLAIYWSNARQREDDYYKRLKQLAITKTNLLLDAGVEPSVLQLIYKNSLTSLPQEEVAIFDTAFHLLYHDAGYIDKVTETKGMIDSILTLKEIHFFFKDLQVNGFVYVHKGTSYVITSAARDEDGLGRLKSLRIQLVISLACAMLLIILAGIYFSRKALQPVSVMIDEVSEISAMSMDLRLAEGNGKDEIAELAMTFNRMLVRLEQSFNAQKQVVSNISHELRTPLAAIIAEAEISAFRDRSVDEYREALRQVLEDARRLARLSDGLLDLAKASYEPSGITFNELRLDEILLDARQRVLQSHDNYRVELVFVKDIEQHDLITIKGNEYLLGVAFSNLIDNACKFSSDHICHISIDARPEKTMIRFADNGIGIPEDEQTKIFTPFYRGSNKRLATGNGIGLSLTQKIILLHNGIIEVNSEVGNGSVFSVIFAR
jgi:signal transduction histidine kinase